MDAPQLHQSLWKGTKQSTHWLSQGKMGNKSGGNKEKSCSAFYILPCLCFFT